VQVQRSETGETVQITCDFLYCCTGYYRYDEGYSPVFPGSERFAGEIVHPQHWPQDLDYTGKRVIVIGSGATAVTLVPALADGGAEHVTMLQRSPSYVLSLPERDPLADKLREKLPAHTAYAIVRWKNVLLAMLNYQLCRRAPGMMRKLLRRLAGKQLPPGFDLDTHFSPRYDPWDQRLCLVPDGDIFRTLSDGRASIETGEIDTFTERGIALACGDEIDADVIVTATGLNMMMLGDVELAVDGREVELGDTVAYKGMMLSGVPNLVMTAGYTNASWTLKADLVAEYVCRVLNHMDARGLAVCVPQAPADDLPRVPIIDLKSGYVLRSVDALPKQGAVAPWRLHQNYVKDVRLLRRGPIDDGVRFSTREQAAHAAAGLEAHGESGHPAAQPQDLLDRLVTANGVAASDPSINDASANGSSVSGVPVEGALR
jgi:monooxygenase